MFIEPRRSVSALRQEGNVNFQCDSIQKHMALLTGRRADPSASLVCKHYPPAEGGYEYGWTFHMLSAWMVL